MTTLIVFLFVLGVLVFVHELGHYLTARLFKVKAYEFGFGLPPRICGWRKINGKRQFFWGNKEAEKIESDDTIWSINWLPIGGFVKIKGENGEERSPDSFISQKPWKRVIIISAGVFMNILLAIVVLSVVFMIGSPQVVDDVDLRAELKDPKIQIYQVLKDSPADKGGLKVGDEIIKVDSVNMSSVEEIQQYISQKDNQEVIISISRFGEIQDIKIIPKYLEEVKSAAMGVSLVKTATVSYPWYLAIWYGIKSTFFMIVTIIIAFYTIIKNLLIGLPAGVEVSGPVGIAVMTGQVARLGFVYLLQFAAMLSINLAIINFLPFPALDGGRAIFIFIEMIRRKPISQKIEMGIHTVGFALLLILIVLVTGRDLFKFKELFFNFFRNIVN